MESTGKLLGSDASELVYLKWAFLPWHGRRSFPVPCPGFDAPSDGRMIQAPACHRQVERRSPIRRFRCVLERSCRAGGRRSGGSIMHPQVPAPAKEYCNAQFRPHAGDDT